MRCLVVDDMKVVLEEECSLLKEAMPDCQICSCMNVIEALQHAEKELFHVAFLDIDLGDNVDGIMLAKQLKDIQPHIHIIFVTAFKEYAVDAFSIHATGYLLKPLQKEQLMRELTFIYDKESDSKKRVRVQTFGNFEVWPLAPTSKSLRRTWWSYTALAWSPDPLLCSCCVFKVGQHISHKQLGGAWGKMVLCKCGLMGRWKKKHQRMR